MTKPPFASQENDSKLDFHLDDYPVVMITASMYVTLDDARFVCTLETCELAAKLEIPIICVDDSSSELYGRVKSALEKKSKGWVHVSRFKGRGRKGASIRQALSIASRCRTDLSSRWVAVFSEFEKVDFLNHLKLVAEPILRDDFDIVTPVRDLELFRETYATEQFHSESLGNTYLNMIWRKEGGTCSPDWLFGPICWEGNSVSPFYLESNEESWDAQIVPSIRASRLINARWAGLTIPYKHHRLQRDQEQGSIEFCEKRIMQLNLMTNVLGRAMMTEGRLPIIIVAGSSGNIGLKVVKRLLTTTAAQYLGRPLSRPATPVDDIMPVLPTKFHLILMDAKPFPEELDSRDCGGHHVEYVTCDFTKYESSWVRKFCSAYTVFLLAAKNPFPEATSADSYTSMLINSNLFEACATGHVSRVAFASSNHVVGGLRKSEGKIFADSTPEFGTKYSITGASMDSTLYAAAKVAGEAQLRAMVASGRISRAIILRIGWCQPGENHVSTISVTGTPTIKENLVDKSTKRVKTSEAIEHEEILSWFKAMHLKNEDLDKIVDCCIAPGFLEAKPSKIFFVNAVSDNPKSRWSVHDNDVGYVPSSVEEIESDVV